MDLREKGKSKGWKDSVSKKKPEEPVVVRPSKSKQWKELTESAQEIAKAIVSPQRAAKKDVSKKTADLPLAPGEKGKERMVQFFSFHCYYLYLKLFFVYLISHSFITSLVSSG